ncbi:hypothetical protein [Oceanihabitans sediminis]|uniref:hypothetical protein n=1 Tax=Oceanihabitans sediminis TaxID=1812012 RepID=UPI003A8CE880
MKKEIILTEVDKQEIATLSNALSNYKSSHSPSAKLTNKQRVLALRADIAAMLSEGFTYEDVEKALATGGLKLKATTIREYLKDSSSKRPGKRKARAASQEIQKENKTGNDVGNNGSNNNIGIQNEVVAQQRTSKEIPEDDFSNL